MTAMAEITVIELDDLKNQIENLKRNNEILANQVNTYNSEQQIINITNKAYEDAKVITKESGGDLLKVAKEIRDFLLSKK